MHTYSFPVEVEMSDDAWHTYVPVLESKGAATWGNTEEEALRNLQEVVQMVVEEMVLDGEVLPHWVIDGQHPHVTVYV